MLNDSSPRDAAEAKMGLENLLNSFKADPEDCD